MKVFISHSSDDQQLAKLVVDLLQRSLGLRSREIRCTSVDGYRLPAGAKTDEQLRVEVSDSEIFVGIVSEASLRSAYVTFELGARWGAGKQLMPLLAPGSSTSSLEGPLSGINALHLERPAEMHQFVHDVGEALNLDAEPPSVYQSLLDQLAGFLPPQGRTRKVANSQASTEESASAFPVEPPAQRATVGRSNFSDFSEAEQVIKRHCLQEWADDYEMRAHCESQQREAVSRLGAGRPEDIPGEVFEIIRAKAASEWATDFEMRLHTEEKQIEAYRELEKGCPVGIPNEVFANVRRRAANEWPDDFEMRLHTEQNQLSAFREVGG